jgi:microcystin degradation protein MlrC
LRVLTATLVTETNTFSPIPTGWEAFGRNGLQHGRNGPIAPSVPDFASMIAWREMALRDGHTVVESVAAVAEPGGLTVRSVYEALRDELLEDLRHALPLDVVLLFLHGAMVAEGYDDCEGDLLARCRELTGAQTIIGAELDLHSHLTPAMLRSADVILSYKEYPHTDIVDRARDLYRLCSNAAAGRTKPVSATYDCRMTGIWPTTAQPLRGFVDRMFAAERDDVLSISMIHGFPWGDVDDGGTKILAISDGDRELAAATAKRFGQELWAIRDGARMHVRPIDAALDEALAVEGEPVVLADVADNAGGGAPGDSTFILRRLLERNIGNVATGIYYDPIAVDLCFDAGPGAALDLRVGGKLGIASGDPLDLRVTVQAVYANHAQDSMDDSGPVPLGRAAWITAQGIDIVLVSVRSQVFAPNAFTSLGVPLLDRKLVVVKSSHHFWAKFAPIAKGIIHVGAPGALQLDFENIRYCKRNLRFWPRVADPFADERGSR